MTRFAVPALASLALLSACAGNTKPPAAWSETVIPRSARPDQPVPFALQLAQGSRAGRFLVLEGAGREITRRETGIDENRWLVRSERDGEPWLAETFEISPDGDIFLVESTSYDDRVITRFDPPLLAVPATLAPDQTREWRGVMRIHPIDRPDELRDEGEARQTVSWGGGVRLRVGGAWVEAWGVRTRLEGSLRAARVESEGWVWVAEEGGVVAERAREEAAFLGLRVRDVRRGLIRR